MTTSVDQHLLFLVNHGMANPLFDALMPFLSDQGYLFALPAVIWALMTIVRHAGQHRSRSLPAGLLLLLLPFAAFFLAEFVNDMIKVAVARPRPCAAVSGIRLLVRCPGSFSLPSGHAADSFAFAAAFFFLFRTTVPAPARWYVLFLAAAIAFSRVYIGVHYPSDILVGALLGIGLGWAISALFRPRKKSPRKTG